MEAETKRAYKDILKDDGILRLSRHYGVNTDNMNVLLMTSNGLQFIEARDGGIDIVLNPNGSINRVTVSGYLLDKARDDRLQKVAKSAPEVA